MGTDLKFVQLHDTYGAEVDKRYELDGMAPNSVGSEEIVMPGVLSEVQIPLVCLAVDFYLSRTNPDIVQKIEWPHCMF